MRRSVLGKFNHIPVNIGELAVEDICKKYDWGIPVGLSFEYHYLTLDARYYFGLMHTMKKSCDSLNRWLSITLGYKFDVR